MYLENYKKVVLYSQLLRMYRIIVLFVNILGENEVVLDVYTGWAGYLHQVIANVYKEDKKSVNL